MKRVLFPMLVHGVLTASAVTYGQLMDAISIVESNRGATSSNVYQLRPIYVADVCRITGQTIRFDQAIGDDALARACITAYWDYYGLVYEHKTGKKPTAQVLARIHNGGPDGWNKPSTRGYWIRVQKVLRELPF